LEVRENKEIEKNVSIVNNELNSFEHQVTIEVNKFFKENVIDRLSTNQEIVKLVNIDIINQKTAILLIKNNKKLQKWWH
ncbi:16503_t:CDS:1, partial [Cetraspora pellucida]